MLEYYKVVFDFDDFKFWAGAYDLIKDATDEQKERVKERLEETFGWDDEIPTKTEINDFVWFECDDIFFPDDEVEASVRKRNRIRASLRNRFSKRIKASDLKYSIEKINDDNWRPGMPKGGYLVRYNLSDRFGWMRMKTFATREEAEEFVNTL